MKANNFLDRPSRIVFAFILLLTVAAHQAQAQGYIAASSFLGGNGSEQQSQSVTDGGYTYIAGQSFVGSGINTFPRTMGTVPLDQWNMTITKMDGDGNIVWSRFLGGNNIEYCAKLVISNGSVFIVGNTASTNFPTTDGTTYAGSGNNGFFARLNATTGDIQFCTMYGEGSAYDINITDGYVYIAGYKINGPVQKADILMVKYDVTTTALIYNKLYGGTGNDSYQNQFYGTNFQVVGNYVYLAFNSGSADFPVTNGSTLKGTVGVGYIKINATTGNIDFATYYGGTGSGFDFIVDLRVDNNGVYIFGFTDAIDFPTTDGSTYGGGSSDDSYLIKFNASNNQVAYSKYIGGDDFDEGISMEVQNNVVYLMMNSNSFNNFPVTSGYTFAQGGGDIAILKLNGTSGDITYSSFITASSSSEYGVKMLVSNGEMYITGITYSNNFPVTNGSVRLGGGGSDETFLTKIGTNNAICFSTFLGHSGSEYPTGFSIEGDNVYISGCVASASFPVTNSSSRSGGYDFYWTKFNLNPAYTPVADVVSPASQTVCRNGIASLLTAPADQFPSGSMPVIYRSGVPNNQNAIDYRYQWQVASSAAGAWTNIPGAIEANYSPQVGVVDQYYRRLTYASLCAVSTAISTSSVAAVLVNSNTAPTVNAGGVINSCVSVPVTLGGSPTAVANGGASIVSYLWTPASAVFTPSSAAANPVVSPTATSIYTVTVTDDNGCIQIGQALVNAYGANAGPDASSCNNLPVRIGSTPIAGLPGVTYSWTSVAGDPVTKLSCTDCAQPDINNLTQLTTYRLTLTVPVTSGGTCTTTDDVVVRPVTGPVTSFGAPDVTTCFGGTASMGLPVEAGFNYTWSPGNYLSANNSTPVTFQPGSLTMISPNPFTYYLTATKNGCIFVDTVVAYVLKADAGLDGCGPRLLGIANPTPTINATYTWTKITAGTGTSDFTGATNQPQAAVSLCTVPTVFQLDVTYNGVTCTDQVLVAPCGCVNPVITVSAPSGCASYNLSAGNVVLTASAAAASTFTWSTTGGVTLSAYTGTTVNLTNLVQGNVTVTATSVLDPSSSCSYSIPVNDPAWSIPSFRALDTSLCPLVPVSIGQAPVAGYTYAWDGLTSNLSPNNIVSNPIATVSNTANFPVLVTDVGSGCIFRDTSTITITGFPTGMSGNSVNFCGISTTVQLGVPAVPNLTYVWTPATTYLPGNTAANPTVTVAATTKFFVTATNTLTGCAKTDSVTITVKPAVTPFSFADQNYCPSTVSALALPAGPAAMTTYAWSPATLVVNPASNGPVATTLAARPQSTTTYTLTVTNASGCTGHASVNFIPNTTLPIAGSSGVICKNSTAQLGGAAEAGATYAWTGTAAAALSSTIISNPVFTPTATGSFVFTVTKTTAAACVTTAQVTITVVDLSIPAIVSPTVCENTCIQIGTISQNGVQYFWSPVSGLSNATISNPVACISTTSKAYTLTAIGTNGCVRTQTVIVGVNPTPAPTVIIPTINTCLGASINTFQPMISPAGSYNFLWSPNNGTLSSIYIQNPDVTPIKIGTSRYNLNVSDVTTGCATNATATINTFYCNILKVPISLNATPNGTVVALQWKVQNQSQLDYYEIEHSVDGQHFTLLERVLAGNINNYSTEDRHPADGQNFYRLKYTDKEGKYGYTDIVKVTMQQKNNVTVYPNPAGQYFNILVSNQMVYQQAEIMLISVDGRIVFSKKIGHLSKLEHVELSNNIKAGNYYVRIATPADIITKEITIIK